MNIPKTTIFAFKVEDYTTILFGQKIEGNSDFETHYYVERGDGTRYKYENYRIAWAKEICAT